MNSLNLTIVVSVASGLVCLLTIGMVWSKRRAREWPARLLFIYAALLCLWNLVQAAFDLGWLVLPPSTLEQVTLGSIVLLSFLFLHLSRSFLRLEGAGWGWWLMGLLWIAALLALENDLFPLPDQLQADGWWLVAGQGLSFSFSLVGWVVFALAAAVVTAIGYMRVSQPLHRNRIAYWFLTLLFTVAGGGEAFIAVADPRYAPWAGALYMLGLLSAAYSVTTIRFVDVRQVVRGFVRYLVGTALAVALYTAAFLLADYLFQAVPGYNPVLIGVALALLMAIVFVPLLRLVQRWLGRLLSGAGYNLSRTLREYSASISNILVLKQLATVSVGLISEALEIKRGALFVVHLRDGDDAEGYYRLRDVGGMGDRRSSSFNLPAQSLVADYLCQSSTPLTQYDVDMHPRFRDISPAEREWLSGLNMDVYVPIRAQDEWIGLLALGPKISGNRYFEDELLFLSTFADQTAVALENARLFDDLKARSEEVARLNQDLTQANAELARIGQAKSDFIDIASHELRTPLTQVRGYADMLKEMLEEATLKPETGDRMLKGLKSAAERLEEIINTMFDVAQIDTETLELKLLPESVSRVIEGAVEEWTEALSERKHTLTLQNLDDLPHIQADYKRLKQAFSHLIQNAIKYTPDGGQIRIEGQLLEWVLPQDQAIEIVVSDTGVGIEKDDLERIFEKFYRVGNVLLHSTGKTKFKGAGPGLGLAIARGIVKAHGGRIWAESAGCDEEKCPGSEFHVVLPLRPQAPTTSKVGTQTNAEGADSVKSFS